MADNNKNVFVSGIRDKVRLCEKRHTAVFTDFCSPAEMAEVYKASPFGDVYFKTFGGNENCERRICCFYSKYDEPEENDFPIKAIKINNNKFSAEVSHRDYLGAVLGLGIERTKIGDIFVFDGSAIIFIKSEMAEYIAANLESVGRNTVKTTMCDTGEAVLLPIKAEDKRMTVSSLRIDSLVGAAFNLSRSRAQALVESEKTAVNWITCTDTSKNIAEGSIISVRGFGRAQLLEICGTTKKDRIAVVIRKFI